LGVLAVVIILILAIFTITLWFTPANESKCPPASGHAPKPSAAQTDTIANTKEYQIQLEFPDAFYPRLAEVEDWMNSINAASVYLNLTMKDLQEKPHNQFLLDASKCHAGSEHYRVRSFLTETTQTIGAKSNAQTKEAAAKYPYWPGSAFLDNSFQKLENDVHACHEKYSRETRISFESPRDYSYCVDLVVLFPWNFDGLSNDELLNPIKSKSFEYWWLGEFSGVMDGMKYQIEFTLQYQTEEALMNESEPPSYAEWSIRTFAENAGFSEEWNIDADNDARNIWNAMQTMYGNAELSSDPECMNVK
jgi:hypothetical protein